MFQCFSKIMKRLRRLFFMFQKLCCLHLSEVVFLFLLFYWRIGTLYSSLAPPIVDICLTTSVMSHLCLCPSLCRRWENNENTGNRLSKHFSAKTSQAAFLKCVNPLVTFQTFLHFSVYVVRASVLSSN